MSTMLALLALFVGGTPTDCVTEELGPKDVARTETGSIEPDEIDCDSGDATQTKAKITHGPVITIKPKG